MKATDRAILLSLAVLGAAVVFYLMILAPKRERAAELADNVSSLESSISEQEQVVAFADQARQEFPKYYGRLVVLGKAVPEGGDSASLIVQLNQIADRSRVEFQALKLGEEAGASAGAAPSPSAAPEAGSPPAAGGTTPPPTEGTSPPPAEGTAPPASGTTPPAEGGSTATPAAASTTPVTPAPATEATAASLPIGASVGPAGLPTLPYALVFRGGFFEVAGFIKGINALVSMPKSGQVAVDGRLLTVDGFALNPDSKEGFPTLEATFSVTSYLSPSAQGLTAGASPTGPAPAAPAEPQATPASAEVTP
ncbi:MAG: hypothetical protein ACRDL6_09185 [Solirubrobacterales bacterium]